MASPLKILFHSAAAASLLLLVITIGLWAGSYASEYELRRATSRNAQNVVIARGQLALHLLDETADLKASHAPRTAWRWEKRPVTNFVQTLPNVYSQSRPPFAGFFFGRNRWDRTTTTMILFPMPLFALLLALLPVGELLLYRRRRLRSRRTSGGLCAVCGYDLRATPQKCPECGATPPPAHPNSSPSLF
jgi:hypothetical protein